MKKKLVVALALITAMLMSCSNKDYLDDLTISSNTWRYAIVEVGGKTYEGEIAKWADYEDSDALKIIFKDGTEVMTSYNKAVLSKNKIEWK